MTASSAVACVAGGDRSLSLSLRHHIAQPAARRNPGHRRSRWIAFGEHHDLRDAARPIGSLGPGQTRTNRTVGTTVEKCRAAALERFEAEAG
jgi:hypothetical protein